MVSKDRAAESGSERREGDILTPTLSQGMERKHSDTNDQAMDVVT